MSFSPEIFQLVILPLLIFLSRVADVSLGTVRVIFISKGLKYLSPLVGFFEILIWLLAMSQIMQNLTSPVCYIAYALGFSAGNYLGIRIAEKLSLGVVLVRVITQKKAESLIKSLNSHNFGVTTVDGKGAHGNVSIIFTVVQRKDVPQLVHIIQTFNPKAFYSIEEVGYVKEGVFPVRKGRFGLDNFGGSKPMRKGK